jgi:preprotein translocase subunit YajC
MHWNTILAQAVTSAPAATTPAATTGTPPPPPGWMSFAPMVLLVIVFYFILIRPQSQQRKKQAALINALKAGDKVVTSSGIVGTVISVKDNTVSLRSADTKMEVTKASVTQILEGTAVTEA